MKPLKTIKKDGLEITYDPTKIKVRKIDTDLYEIEITETK